jgi:hypothetical protein
VAIDLIVQHIRTKLGQHDLCKIHPNLYVIQTTYQVPNVKHSFLFFLKICLLFDCKRRTVEALMHRGIIILDNNMEVEGGQI